MPSARELEVLWSYWPQYDIDSKGMTLYTKLCSLCGAIIPYENIETHKKYHIKLLDRLDSIEEQIKQLRYPYSEPNNQSPTRDN